MPECNHKLAVAVQIKAGGKYQYLVFCCRVMQCPEYAAGRIGHGKTEEEARADYERQNQQQVDMGLLREYGAP